VVLRGSHLSPSLMFLSVFAHFYHAKLPYRPLSCNPRIMHDGTYAEGETW
jgi:hypothetical protein